MLTPQNRLEGSPCSLKLLGKLGLLSWQFSWEYPPRYGMDRFGAGQEHRLRCFWGLMVPVRSTEKGILAKSLFFLLMALPLASVPRTKGVPGLNPSLEWDEHLLPWTSSREEFSLLSPPRGSVPSPWLWPCPHAVSVACHAPGLPNCISTDLSEQRIPNPNPTAILGCKAVR